MNIEGLSEETLKKFLEKGFVENYPDLFRLEKHQAEITSHGGLWGEILSESDCICGKGEKPPSCRISSMHWGINHVGAAKCKAAL